jgi:hypothetical protein
MNSMDDDLPCLRKHHDIEQSLRDMEKSARMVRDVTVGEKPSEDSHEQVFVEYDERMAAIQASAQAMSDLQSRIDRSERANVSP